MAKPLPARILRLCRELGIRLHPARARSDYSSGREVPYAAVDERSDGDAWLVERTTSGVVFAGIIDWNDKRCGTWGAQRVMDRDGERFVLRSHIYRSANTLPEILREIAS